MQLHRHLAKTLFGRVAMAIASLSGFMLLAGATEGKAQGLGDYARRVDTAKYQWHEAIEHHGYNSSQARYWRHKEHEAYQQVALYRRNEVRERERQEREYRKQERREHEWREHRRAGDDDRRGHDGDR